MKQNKSNEKGTFSALIAKGGYSQNREKDYQRFYKLVFKGIKPSRKIRILDVGCGPGINSERLYNLGFRVSGVDLVEDAIKIAKKRARSKSYNIDYKIGDIEDLSFADNSFDIVFCGAVLHHLPDMKKAAAEIYRILKPGGKVISYDPNAHNPYGFFCHNVLNKYFKLKYFTDNEVALSKNELNNAFKKVGFKNFRFFSISMHSIKKGIVTKVIRYVLYYIFEKMLWGLRKGVFLVMICEK